MQLPSTTHINSIINYEVGPFDHLLTQTDQKVPPLASPYKTGVLPNMNASVSVPNLQSPYDIHARITKNTSAHDLKINEATTQQDVTTGRPEPDISTRRGASLK